MRFFSQYEQLFSELEPRTLLLTPNQRMSRFVQAQYGLWRQSRGDHVWPSLKIHSFSVWVQNSWQSLQASAAHPATAKWLLGSEQERLIWLQAINESDHGYDLLADDSMADLAAQAWRFMRLWQKRIEDVSQSAQEQQVFCDWVERYEALCERNGLLDTTAQLEVVSLCLEDGKLVLPEHMVLLGFDDISPLEQRVIAALRQRQVEVSEADIRLAGTCERLMLADTDTELMTMARWAAALVEANSDCSIGLVIPDLANLRARVTRILEQVFEPQSVFVDRPRHAPGFNISAAQPLAQTPLIAAALAALQLNRTHIELEQAQQLLASPFIGDEQELAGRTQLFTKLSQRYLKVPCTAIRAMAGEPLTSEDDPLCPNLHQRLHQFHARVVGHREQSRAYSAWAEIFDLQLQALGWPGQRTLDTLEFQQLEHWPQLLSQLAALDRLDQQVSFNQALSQLARFAYTPFHAQTSDSPVQVLGLLEAAGQQFDYLWVMGLNNRMWPEPSKPNPLLPVDLQRQWQMPRASAERELLIAKRLTQRLLSSAHTVIVSAPLVEGDQPLQPSPLIADIPAITLADLTLADQPDYKALLMGQRLEQALDERAPAVEHVSKLRGGTQILKNQAACPFKAFAIHRLQAHVAEPLKAGITPLVRGNLVHRALEAIWLQLQDQSALLALSEEGLAECITTAIGDAWRSIYGQELLGPQLKALEQERAHRLIKAWLELEKQRPPFKVLFNEKAVTYPIGGIPLVIRYDRVDELDDKSLLVLDYKTGRTNLSAWAGSRPDEPQVPLYAVAQGERVRAAAFVQLNAQELGAKGIATNPDILSGLNAPESMPRLELPDRWQDIVEHWRVTLSRLADDFVGGDARVAPKSRSLTCRYCDLHSLCRIRSQMDAISDEDARDDD